MSSLRILLPQQVDSTALAAFRTCPQRWAFEHGLGLRDPQPSVDLVAGGAFAAGREAFYRASYGGALRPAAFDAARAAFDAEWGAFTLPADSKSPKTKPAVWNALTSYVAEFNPPHDRIGPLSRPGESAFEWKFSIPLDETTTGLPDWPVHPESGLPFLYAGRCDAIGLLDGTLPVVLDDKTTSRFDTVSTWVSGIQRRAQFLGYVWAAQRLVDAMLEHVVVRQTAIRASGSEHRESPLVAYSRFEIAQWLRATRSTLRRMVDAWRNGEFEAALGDVCVSWSRPCEFLDACRSEEPEERLASFVERRWDPLAATTNSA